MDTILIFALTVAVIVAGGVLSIVLAFKSMETVTPWAIILSILPTVGVLLHSSAFFLS